MGLVFHLKEILLLWSMGISEWTRDSLCRILLNLKKKIPGLRQLKKY